MAESIQSQLNASLKSIEISAEQAAAGEHEIINPDRFDFYWRPDGSGVAIRLAWWDEASYIRYQSDCGD